MKSAPINWAMWKMVYPSFLSMAVASAFYVCEYILFGQTGSQSSQLLTAVSIVSPIEQGVINSVSLLAAVGGATLLSQCIGQGDLKRGEELLGNSVFLQLLFYGFLSVSLPPFLPFLLRLLGASVDSSTFSLSFDYISILIKGCITTFLYSSFSSFIRGQGAVLVACALSVIYSLVNFTLDVFLVYRQQYALIGASIASLLTSFAAALAALLFLQSSYSTVHLHIISLQPSWHICLEIIRCGLPASVSGLAIALISFFTNRLLIHFAPPATASILVAAWGALSKVYFVGIMPLLAVAQGVTPLLACSVGAKDFLRFRSCARRLWFVQQTLATIAAIVLCFHATSIARWFSTDAIFGSFFAPALRWVASGIILQPAITTVYPMLQALGAGGQAAVLLGLKECVLLLGIQIGLSWIWKSHWGFVYAYPVTNVLSLFLAGFFYWRSCRPWLIDVPNEDRAVEMWSSRSLLDVCSNM